VLHYLNGSKIDQFKFEAEVGKWVSAWPNGPEYFTVEQLIQAKVEHQHLEMAIHYTPYQY
jgi:hypothetical protein